MARVEKSNILSLVNHHLEKKIHLDKNDMNLRFLLPKKFAISLDAKFINYSNPLGNFYLP